MNIQIEINRLKKRISSKLETLDILLDDKERNSLLQGMQDIKKGEVVSLEEFLKK